MYPSFSTLIDLDSQRFVRFDEVVPSLEEIDGMRMYLNVFTAVHASADKPCQRVANSEIKPFYVRSADSAIGMST